jgi:hypothetical protein
VDGTACVLTAFSDVLFNKSVDEIFALSDFSHTDYFLSVGLIHNFTL